MSPIRKRIVTDENNQPVAVQIDYADWLELEKIITSRKAWPASAGDLNSLRGTLKFSGDAVELQRQWRSEWR